jgi:hypothetical protein
MQGAQGFLNIRKIQDSLRAGAPPAIGERRVLQVEDRWSEDGPLGKIKSETDRMSRDMLIFRLEGDARIVLRPSGTESKNKIYVEVAGQPLGAAASAAALAAEKKRLDDDARALARAFTREALSRLSITLPDYALEISDLVALENKQDFAEKFLPEVVTRLERGEAGPGLDSWIDARLGRYGADARLLVTDAVRAYVLGGGLPGELGKRLAGLFPRKR